MEADLDAGVAIPPEPVALNWGSSETEVDNRKVGEFSMPHVLLRSPKNFARSKTLGGALPPTEDTLLNELPSFHMEQDVQTPSPDKLGRDEETMTPSPVPNKVGHDRQTLAASVYDSLSDKANRISGSGAHSEEPLQSRLVYDSVWNRL